jgi:hypothetical protein
MNKNLAVVKVERKCNVRLHAGNGAFSKLKPAVKKTASLVLLLAHELKAQMPEMIVVLNIPFPVRS